MFIVISLLILALSLRGLPGNITPHEMTSNQWTIDGPFELSPERGRFALTFSLVENQSFSFSLPLAQFAIPDVGYFNGRYVSLFAPLVSFIIMPGYLIGKYFGASQVGAYSVIAIVALSNAILIRLISKRLGASTPAATLAGLVFLFATPAFAYAVNLYQHHLTTLLLLGSIYVLTQWKTIWSVAAVSFLFALAVPLDYPNLIILFPILLYTLTSIVEVITNKRSYTLKFHPSRTLGFLSVSLPLLFFVWFNLNSYQHPFKLSGTVPSVREIGPDGKPQHPQDLQTLTDVMSINRTHSREQSALGFFKTRNLRNGLYTHIISPDRGMIFYATVVLIYGIVGFILAYRYKFPLTGLLLSVVGANVLLYSMWGDPWGGWAFGSRYLIPTYAILAIYTGIALDQLKKSKLQLGIFGLVLVYSIAVNTLGAITSSMNPPKVEVWALEEVTGTVQKYTFERNWDFLNRDQSKSFIYQTIAWKYLFAQEYYLMLVALLATFSGWTLYQLRKTYTL